MKPVGTRITKVEVSINNMRADVDTIKETTNVRKNEYLGLTA